MLSRTSYKNMFAASLYNQGVVSNRLIYRELLFQNIRNSACAAIWGYERKSFFISIPEAIK